MPCCRRNKESIAGAQMILMCPCIIDFIGGMDYKGEWGGGGPGHSWALKWHERSECQLGPGVLVELLLLG